jgi:hypothetical protein
MNVVELMDALETLFESIRDFRPAKAKRPPHKSPE